jgi:hypothetical protein
MERIFTRRARAGRDAALRRPSLPVERARLARWRWRLAIADFREACLGETPKPTSETLALPEFQKRFPQSTNLAAWIVSRGCGIT